MKPKRPTFRLSQYRPGNQFRTFICNRCSMPISCDTRLGREHEDMRLSTHYCGLAEQINEAVEPAFEVEISEIEKEQRRTHK